MTLTLSLAQRSGPIFSRLTTYRRKLSKSAVQGPLQPPLSTKTLPEYFATEVLSRYNSRPALICRKERPRSHGGPPSRNLDVTSHLAWDYAEFDTHINALARGLLGMGVQKGDRVGVIMGNTSSYAMLQLACASIGAILVTLNPAYRLTELLVNYTQAVLRLKSPACERLLHEVFCLIKSRSSFQTIGQAATLNLAGVKHIFLVPRLRSSEYVRMFAEAFPEIRGANPGELQVEDLPQLRNIVVVDNAEEYRADLAPLHIKGTVDWREILMWREDAREVRVQKDILRGLNQEEVISLQFTSGTTGLPKAVSLTHSNLLNNGISIGRCMRLTEKDILWNLAAWSHGSCIVYPSDTFDPPAIVDAVVAEKCTALHGVPTHFLGVLSEVDKRRDAGFPADMSSLRTGIAAGSPIPIDLMKSLIGKLHLTDLTNAYGMTETSPVSFQTTPADPIIKRVETVGKVQPHVKAKIIDGDGNVVDVGMPGEICVAGYLLQKGYWHDEEQTASVMKTDENGTLWMHTGDEGIMDEEGYLRVVGRIKDLIIRGGENLFPVQIENAMTSHPEVREAAAVAVPDDVYGEVVGAWVVREPHTNLTREQLRESVAAAMNPQNAPAWVWFMGEEGCPEELPKTASGKVQKHVLRKWSRELAASGVGLVYRK